MTGAEEPGGLITAAELRSEIRRWAELLEVEPTEIHIKAMKRKWASCSTKGRLTFDTGLLERPPDFRADVIVHELLHLKVPNHGRLFKALLRAYATGVKDSVQQPAPGAHG